MNFGPRSLTKKYISTFKNFTATLVGLAACGRTLYKDKTRYPAMYALTAKKK